MEITNGRDLKLGDIVNVSHSHGKGTMLLGGLIGEVDKGGFFVWHNQEDGAWGGSRGVLLKRKILTGYTDHKYGYYFDFDEVGDRFNFSIGDNLVAVDTKELLTEETSKAKKVENKKIEVKLYREGGETYFEFTIDPRIEEVYKNMKGEIRESSNWEGLKFYYLPEVIENHSYKKLLSDYSLIDNYGQPIYLEREQRFNMAFLRTVSGTGKIKVPNNLPFSEVSLGLKRVCEFIRTYHENFLEDYSVKGIVYMATT